jgi:hypothetical protein
VEDEPPTLETLWPFRPFITSIHPFCFQCVADITDTTAFCKLFLFNCLRTIFVVAEGVPPFLES